MTVPSNLIPFRITQLPVDPSPSVTGILMYVRDGVSYQVTADQIVSVTGVPLTRQVNAGTGLTGGGPLSSNVTISVAPGGIGSTELANSGVTPGVYGGATDIPVLTVDATGRVTAATTSPFSITGFVPTTRQVIAGTGLNGGGTLASNVTLNANLSNATPESVNTTGTPGVSTDISRSDHKHPAIDLADDDQVDGLLGLDNGGTNKSIVPDEGAVVWCGADGFYLTGIGTVGQVLSSNATGAPTWIDQGTLDVAQADNLNGGAPNKIAYQSNVNITDFIDAPTVTDTFLKWNGASFEWDAVAGAGTVTSVSGSGGTTGLTLAGGPITAAGTLTIGGTLAIGSGGTGLSATPTNGQLLIGNGAGYTLTGLTAGTAVSITSATGSITIANTAPDQTVVLSDGTAISVTGTYPSFTITNTLPDQTVVLTDGTAISVTGTYPSFTVTNTLPDQTVTLTDGGDITVSGTYPSFTLTNAAPDQTVVLTDGTAISVTGTYPSFTVTNTLPDQTVILTNGTGVSITGTYPSFTVTNSAPDQTVTLTGGGGTSVTGTYPSFTISTTVTGGTVTSVDASTTISGFTLTGGPITGSGIITLAGTLAISNGGTGASTQSGARTALGLGTMATQDASSVSITGGSIGSSVLVNLTNSTGTISGGTY